MLSNENINNLDPTQNQNTDKVGNLPSDKLDITSLGRGAAYLDFDENTTRKSDTEGEAENISDKQTQIESDEDFAEYYDPALLFGFTVEVDDVTTENCCEMYEKAVQYLQTAGANVDKAIALLNKCAECGCADAYIALGQLYCEAGSPLYNQALAYECFYYATELGKGFYYLGLCYIDGLGCEKNAERAIELFFDGAEREDIDCLCALGICREFGIGCDIDYEMAVALYTRAADLGNATAINNLGGCYFYGHGVEQNKEYATELYMQAAELGNSNAECRLGICCENGDGCQKDPSAAFEHYKRAAMDNNPIALYRMAICYDKGIGVKQNFAHAYDCYLQSAKHGCAEAMYETGKMCKYARGTHKNPDEAYKWFAKAAENGVSGAIYEVGNCYFEGFGAVRNYELALLRYNSAFQVDPENASAALKIGICYLNGLGVQKNEAIAFEWFKTGAKLHSRTSLYMLGECYFFGVGVQENKEYAADCYDKSISYDFSYTERTVPCLLALAECLEYGLGIEKDHNRALSLYKRAAGFGDAVAMYKTGQAILRGVGIRAEYAVAREVILKSARKGYVPAMLAMGIFADEGKGIPKNPDDAARWYKMVIDAEAINTRGTYEFPQRYAENRELISKSCIEAYFRLGAMPTKRRSTIQDYITAYEHTAYAASCGHEEAQMEIARIYLHQGDLKSYYEGLISGNSSVSGEEESPGKTTVAIAMNKLGDSYYDGKASLGKNKAAATRCYKASAELGNADGAYSYGWCLRHGVGIAEDDAEAAKWLKLSADKGNHNAAYSYALCCEDGSGSGVKNKSEARSYYRKAASAGHIEAAKRYVALSKQDD